MRVEGLDLSLADITRSSWTPTMSSILVDRTWQDNISILSSLQRVRLSLLLQQPLTAQYHEESVQIEDSREIPGTEMADFSAESLKSLLSCVTPPHLAKDATPNGAHGKYAVRFVAENVDGVYRNVAVFQNELVMTISTEKQTGEKLLKSAFRFKPIVKMSSQSGIHHLRVMEDCEICPIEDTEGTEDHPVLEFITYSKTITR